PLHFTIPSSKTVFTGSLYVEKVIRTLSSFLSVPWLNMTAYLGCTEQKSCVEHEGDHLVFDLRDDPYHNLSEEEEKKLYEFPTTDVLIGSLRALRIIGRIARFAGVHPINLAGYLGFVRKKPNIIRRYDDAIGGVGNYKGERWGAILGGTLNSDLQ
ncbi:MAG: hypothetical protein Q9218_004879, partial [Villophora microphyllina]